MNQLYQCALTRSSRTDQCHCLSWKYLYIYVFKNRAARLISECNILESHMPPPPCCVHWQWLCSRGIPHLVLHIQYLHHPPRTRRCRRESRGNIGEGLQRGV